MRIRAKKGVYLKIKKTLKIQEERFHFWHDSTRNSIGPFLSKIGKAGKTMKKNLKSL